MVGNRITVSLDGDVRSASDSLARRRIDARSERVRGRLLSATASAGGVVTPAVARPGRRGSVARRQGAV